MYSFKIEDRVYNSGNPMLIAELGTSHGGDLTQASELISAAAEAGADCVKFQIVYADEILHPNTGEVELPGGKIRLYDRFKELEAGPHFFQKLKEITEKLGLIFLCTPFGIKSARELRNLNPVCIKIASPELNYSSLIKEISTYNLPTILSSGVSRLGDIEEALDLLRINLQIEGQICLLHCVTAYPAPETDYNLRLLNNLSSIFGIAVGVSDHSLDPELVPVLSTVMGAAVIEKHFCLSTSGMGLDDPIALTPQKFSLMANAVRAASKDPEGALKEMYSRHGVKLVEAILGDGVKRLSTAEKANYGRTNRSLHSLRDIEAGEVINKEMFAVLRTEKLLKPGLPPSYEDKIIGRTAKNIIPAGDGINFEDI